MNVFRPYRMRAVAIVALTGFLASCTTDPFTGEQKVANTTKGVAIGAAAGAAVGALAGRDRAKGAAIGAGVGALAGGAVGGYMDAQERKLREQLQGTGVSVTRMGDELILNMPGNITFPTDGSDIRSDFYPVLNSVVLVVKRYQKTLIEVAGHTDSTGSAAHNQQLSQRRAASVGNYFAGQGIRAERILTAGLGMSLPIAPNTTAEGRQQNRRVELRLVPLTE